MSSNESRSIELFISYAHEDEPLRQELTKHLTSLRRQGVIREWHDREIPPGGEWDKEINEHLKSAQVILLLISPDFMASDYCNDVEVKQALERHERGEAVVIPVVLRSVDWEGAPFQRLQALPRDAKPVMSWPDRDEAMLNVTQGIRRLVEDLKLRSAPRQGPAAELKWEARADLRRRWELVLSASFDEADKSRVEAVVSHLRELTGDMSITVLEILEGSVRLILEGTAEAYETIEELFKSGRLIEVEGFKVESVRVVLNARDKAASGRRAKRAEKIEPSRSRPLKLTIPPTTGAKGDRAAQKGLVVGDGPDLPTDGEAYLLNLLRDAVRAVPAVKYALGVAGVAAAVSIVAGFRINLRVAVLGVVIMLGLMAVLVVFSSFVRSGIASLKQLGLILAWTFVFLTVATAFFIFTGFFFSWPRPLEQTVAQIIGETPTPTPATTPTPPPQARILHYSILVCKPHTDPDCLRPFPLAGEINFEARYRIRLNVSSPQPGFLYVINEGPQTAGGLPEYVMLFPTERVNDGSAGLDADKVITFPNDFWLKLDAEEGKEKLWLVWSASHVSELEAAARTVAARARQDKGAVTVPGDIVAVHNILGRYAAAPPRVTKSEELGRTVIEAQSDTLAYAVVLEHH